MSALKPSAGKHASSRVVRPLVQGRVHTHSATCKHSESAISSDNFEEDGKPQEQLVDESGPSPWHALLATWLGGVFDGMDSSIFAIVLYPALSDLLKNSDYSVVGMHGSYIIALFMLGWAIGAMIFGRLADHFGRA
ncbi:MAG: hypothetical protein K2Z81_16530, partial [Cyanobacteria bacterium]|nr:hypothetical protein [Cyanobacteriota bacterium]